MTGYVDSYKGMGDGAQIVGATTGVLSASAWPTALLIGGAAAGPVGLAIGAGIAAIGTLLSVMGVGSGCGQSCIQASNIANQIEDVMKQNLAAYRAGQISGNVAISNFDQLFAQLRQSCLPIPGDAGKNCIGDRERGGKWDWYSYYRDPISPDPPAPDSVVNSVLGGSVGGINTGLLIGGALILVGLAVSK